MLSRLEEEEKELRKEKECLERKHSDEYEKVVDRILEIRKSCNQRKS